MLSLLRLRLHLAISYWVASRDAVALSAEKVIWLQQIDNVLPSQAIPLKLTGKATSLVYVCPIAHRLATQPYQAATIAAQFVDTLLHLEALPQGVTAQATVAGFIYFDIGDRAIASWLDQRLANAMPDQPLPPASMTEGERQVMLQSAALFEIQYAHARCCSLLRLAHREALISLETLGETPLNWQFNTPIPFPWLTTADELLLKHPADRHLLMQLFNMLDQIYDASQKRTSLSIARSAQAVSRAFQDFHRGHPLCNRTEQEPALVTAQLGLLMVTQRILHLLLAERLHLRPAIEL